MPHLRQTRRSAAVTSALVHGCALALLVASARKHPGSLKPLRLPGTLQGQHMLLTYSTGGPPAPEQTGVVHSPRPFPSKPKLVKPSPSPALAPPSKALTEAGSGSSGQSAFGDENVRVALPARHPRPQPDLSSLPPGTAGDVVVDVTIDDTGKVTTATLVKGLGVQVDSAVVQALRDWTFTPATRNGTNIASEQEILIHYERG